MTKKVYNLMDWAAIEAITYSEEDHPKTLLGPHEVGSQTLIQAFLPQAKSVSVRVGRSKTPVEMELADESGYYACLIKRRLPFTYTFICENEDGSTTEFADPYQFDDVITEKDILKFANGIHYRAYEILGAHVMEIDGIKGTHFAVWAPNAMRVSVVGDFNHWDGRLHQMEKVWDSGIFELFIPRVEDGAVYKYEIKTKNSTILFKADPYGFGSQLRPDNASVVRDLSVFEWNDDAWIAKREKTELENEPVAIYEVHLGSWKKPEDREFFNYREIAPELAKYVKKMGYTHIELMPVMEHPLDESWGYQVVGYYAPTSRYGTPEDFAWFMDYMHSQGIGVILDWVPAHFPRDAHGLSFFDGTHLYESADTRLSDHPDWGTLIFDYSRPEVRNYLIASALFWVSVYHADGIRMDAVASMLYLDYGKQGGEWVPNMYGGKENLDAVELLKHLNSVFAKNARGAVVIAEESTAWPQVTGSLSEGGLGFDYKWNMGWMNDFLGYMRNDPYFRTNHYNELCFPMIYAYSEKFILPFSHDEVVHGKGSLLSMMPGTNDEKFANLKAALGFLFTHPGKKLLFMGQDIGEFDEWNEKRSVEWNLLEYADHKWVNDVCRDLISLYRSEPALYKLDHDYNGFEWINCISANENIVVYLRKTEKAEETLLVVVNFENIPRKNYKIGVPFAGKYKEIFNSDAEKYGGFDFRNTRTHVSEKDECDGRENSIKIKVPPLAISIFSCTPEEPENKEDTAEEKKIEKTEKKDKKSKKK